MSVYSILSISIANRNRYCILEANVLKTHTASCDALRDLGPFVQFKKREKHPWRSVTFGKVAG